MITTHEAIKAEFLFEHSIPLTRAFDDAVTVIPTAIEHEACYYAALAWIDAIDPGRPAGHQLVRHYHDRAGVLLTRLDEVVRAILNDDLASPPAVIDRPAG